MVLRIVSISATELHLSGNWWPTDFGGQLTFVLFFVQKIFVCSHQVQVCGQDKAWKAMENACLLEVSKGLELKFYIITKQIKYYL